MLEQETVRRVAVDLYPGVRDQAAEQVGVVRQDHRVAVAIRHEHRHLQAAEPLEHRVVGDSPCAYRVILRLTTRPGCWRVPVLGPGVDTPKYFLASLPARRG